MSIENKITTNNCSIINILPRSSNKILNKKEKFCSLNKFNEKENLELELT